MPDTSLLGLLLRLAVSMGVVISLMLLAARILRKSAARVSGRGGRTVRTPISVAAMQPLTKTARVAVVRAAGREMILGITDQQVTLLHSAIEPRDTLVDLDVEDALRLDDEPEQITTGSARIAQPDMTPIAADAASTESSSAWTDALEMLRDRTVRR